MEINKLDKKLQKIWCDICDTFYMSREKYSKGRSIPPQGLFRRSKNLQEFIEATALACSPSIPDEPEFYKWMPFHLKAGRAVDWKADFRINYNVMAEERESSLYQKLNRKPLPDQILFFVGSLNVRVINKSVVNILEQKLKELNDFNIIALAGPKLVVDDKGHNYFIDLAEKYKDQVKIYYSEELLPIHLTVFRQRKSSNGGDISLDYRFPHYEFEILRSSAVIHGKNLEALLMKNLGLSLDNFNNYRRISKDDYKNKKILISEKDLTAGNWLSGQLIPDVFETGIDQYKNCPWKFLLNYYEGT